MLIFIVSLMCLLQFERESSVLDARFDVDAPEWQTMRDARISHERFEKPQKTMTRDRVHAF